MVTEYSLGKWLTAILGLAESLSILRIAGGPAEHMTSNNLSGSSTESAMRLDDFYRNSTEIIRSIETVIDGKREAVQTALTVLLAEGHLLIEDVPGVGKTMLARALAKSVDCTVNRIQFTPDLLPSDITGVTRPNVSSSSSRDRSSPTS